MHSSLTGCIDNSSFRSKKRTNNTHLDDQRNEEVVSFRLAAVLRIFEVVLQLRIAQRNSSFVRGLHFRTSFSRQHPLR